MTTSIKTLAQDSKAWPFELARNILKKLNNKTPKKGFVLFETGYGPSGLPHIGTYVEIVRTKMVQNAFEKLAPDIPTKLIVVSDDMDGFRKIPEGIPNARMLENYLQYPLTSVPDPFGKCESYGHYMNAKLKDFLEQFGFEYEFKSATELYKSGTFDTYLLKCLEQYDQIMSIMLPTLREERQKTYSPFLPICPETNKVLYVPITNRNTEEGTITYMDERTNKSVTIPVTGGHCKLQWKPDFGMRWAALDVDFEMYGKDHLANGPIYSNICKAIGGKVPEQFFHEMFLDEHGSKISKSKGNGISIDQWLRYASVESLAYYLYQSPQRAKKLFFDVIPKSIDEYITFCKKFHESDKKDQIENPVAHVHNFDVPKHNLGGLTFNLLLNLASACNPTDSNILIGFINKYAPGIATEDNTILNKLVGYAMNYYHDFVKPHKVYRTPTHHEQELLRKVKSALKELPKSCAAIDIQNMFYTIANDYWIPAYAGTSMRDFFLMIYETLLGQKEGPRLGSFAMLYGVNNMIELIDTTLKTHNK